jgi:hypothetical protein
LLVFPVFEGGANTTLFRAMFGAPPAASWSKGKHELFDKGPVNRVKGLGREARRRHEVVWRGPVRFDVRKGDKLVEGVTRRGGQLDMIVPKTPSFLVDVEGMGKYRGDAGLTVVSIRFGQGIHLDIENSIAVQE